ncbi:MAG: thermonuclease family protein [Clostridia bacterium]|nr:thermonuclease family protein [Deltaproteobacteria bacterium]
MISGISGRKSETLDVRSAPATEISLDPTTSSIGGLPQPPSVPARDILVKAEVTPSPEPRRLRTVVFPPLSTTWTPPASLFIPDDPKAVSDGDSARGVSKDGVRYSLRFADMNAPESRPAEAGSDAAQQRLEKLVRGKETQEQYTSKDPRDSYGRLVARVSVDGELVAKDLISKGLAHCYFILGPDDIIDRSELVTVQKAAQDAKIGIWAQPRFQKQLTLTSWHPNGRGNDIDNPNIEYFRVCNISQSPLKLGGYVVTNKAGKSWTLPKVTVPVGHTLMVFSGQGTNQLEPPTQLKIYLGSRTEVWNNIDDRLTLRDRKGELVFERLQQQDPINLSKLAAKKSISQKDVRALGSDTRVSYSGPTRISLGDYERGDGDSLGIAIPKTGEFNVTINGRLTRPLEISKGDQSSTGRLDVRFYGVDCPETEVVAKLPTGERVFASQGLPGEIAKKMLYAKLDPSVDREVEPLKRSPFDFYNRLLGIVWATTGEGVNKKVENINHWLIAEGHGEMVSTWSKDFDVHDHEARSALAKLAFTEKRGIYGDGTQKLVERPADFRRRVQGRPPSDDLVIDWTTKLVYPYSALATIEPWKRVYILKKDADLAMRDKRFNFELAPLEGTEPLQAAVNQTRPKSAKADRTQRRPTASVLRLQISEKTQQA